MDLAHTYGLYNSIVSDGQRIRRMRRTELSCEKICQIMSPRISMPNSNISWARSQEKRKRSGSQPKIESIGLARKKKRNSVAADSSIDIQNDP